MAARIGEFCLRAAQVLLHRFDLRVAIRVRLLRQALRLRAELQGKYLYRVFDNVGGTSSFCGGACVLMNCPYAGMSVMGVPD